MKAEAAQKDLEDRIASTHAQLRKLQLELDALKRQGGEQVSGNGAESNHEDGPAEREPADGNKSKWPLLQEEYKRYGRQMIVEQIGLKGQLKLRESSVLIVGAGGLGCPAAMYLAGAGVGTLGLIDGDTVEPSNLHRQVLHRTKNVGKFKVDSAIEYLEGLNPHPRYIGYAQHLTSETAPDLFAAFDIILDCTDNPATRYLISDTAVLLGKPLVSASALRTDGQLMILNHPSRPPGDEGGGPCYRCVFPVPPPAESVLSCADGGILGPVVGVMGVMQALETIRVLTAATDQTPIVPSLHLFSAYSMPPFRSVKLRRRRADCRACSSKASVTLDSLRSGSMDYVQFCGSLNPTRLLSAEQRITAREYAHMFSESGSLSSEPPVLLDVRERVQYDICALPKSINCPMSEIMSSEKKSRSQSGSMPAEEALPSWASFLDSFPETQPVHVVCRQGNDSQIVVKKLQELGIDRGGARVVRDIKGGIDAWRRDVDRAFPDY